MYDHEPSTIYFNIIIVQECCVRKNITKKTMKNLRLERTKCEIHFYSASPNCIHGINFICYINNKLSSQMCIIEYVFIGIQTPNAAPIPSKKTSSAPLHVVMNDDYIKNGKYDLQVLLIVMISKKFGECLAVVRIMYLFM